MSASAIASDEVFDAALSPGSELPAEGSTVGGRFRIGRLLGEGGMSAVFLARDERLGREVAFKVLSPYLAHSREVVARFVNEARTLARLDSEHIVRVLDAGVTAEPEYPPLPYMVLELLHGEDLRSQCERGPVASAERAITWILQACEGLAVAHAAGMIHRDLKPENLYLTRDHDGREVVKLLDFGVARSLALPSSLTQSGEGVGSPGYMSPEQLNDATKVDERSDIWSLGVVLYELLAGVPPFHASNTFELCAQILAARPPRLRRFRADLPRGLAAVVHRCLEVDPNKRFSDISELAEALAEFCTGFAGDTALRIRRRLPSSDSAEFAAPELIPIDVHAPTQPDFGDGPISFVRSHRRLRSRRMAAHTLGWLAVGGMLALLCRAFFPSALPSTAQLWSEAESSVERATVRVNEAARSLWSRDDDHRTDTGGRR